MKTQMKLLMKTLAVAAFAAIAIASGCSQPEDTDTLSDNTTASQTPGTQIYQAKGVVKSIDKNAREIAIAHEEIPGLMSAMTMDFAVKDPAMLETVAPGDAVDFELERSGQGLTVTKIMKSGGNELADGASVFKANCAKCHGNDGSGSEKGISFLEGHALDHSRDDFLKRVKEGKEDKMPAFGEKLSEKEVEAVVTYVRDVIQKDVKKKDTGGHEH